MSIFFSKKGNIYKDFLVADFINGFYKKSFVFLHNYIIMLVCYNIFDNNFILLPKKNNQQFSNQKNFSLFF